jgi:cell division control protein 6
MELDMQGIIDAQKRTAGSVGGPAWYFELQVATDIVVEVLEEISRLEDIDLNAIETNYDSRLDEY